MRLTRYATNVIPPPPDPNAQIHTRSDVNLCVFCCESSQIVCRYVSGVESWLAASSMARGLYHQYMTKTVTYTARVSRDCPDRATDETSREISPKAFVSKRLTSARCTESGSVLLPRRDASTAAHAAFSVAESGMCAATDAVGAKLAKSAQHTCINNG